MTLTVVEKTDQPVIRTPDQRLRVFISSTMKELSAERTAVQRAISQLHLIPVLFESGARPHPPRELYRAYLSQSHIFIGIYWQSYGWVAPDMDVSGLEDEYQLSLSLPRLIYVKTPAPERDPQLSQLLSRIQVEDRVCYKYFSSLEELQELVTADLILLLSEQFERSQNLPALRDQSNPVKRTNLPSELTLFIGREQQVTTVSGLLQQDPVRLVTLTGPGGVGKTRLALKVASGLLSNFNEVWLVELAPLAEPTLLLPLIAETLGLREENSRPLFDTFSDYVAEKEILLILDNCEHLIAEVTSLVSSILKTAPGLHVLATSREPLGVTGEIVWSIPPLSSPGIGDGNDLEKFSQFESVKLFVDRAAAARHDFKLTKENAPALASILSRLDGIPLAIELAAARVRMLSLEELSSRLDSSFQLLVGSRAAAPRQQTLENLIEWSYVLLSEKECLLFHRLSVFSGGWSLQAAEQVCSGGSIAPYEVLDLLCSLVDKSLVSADVQSCCERYRFLETIRQFSVQRYEQSSDKEETMRKHAEYYTMLAESAYGGLWGANQQESLCQLSAEIDNVRAAFAWLADSKDGELLLLRMAGSLWHFWEITGPISEGRSWLELALAKNPAASPYLRANGLRGLANLVRQHGDYVQAVDYHRQSLALFKELGFTMSVARELNDLGEIEWLRGNYERSVDLHTKSLSLRRSIKDAEGIAVSLQHLGNIARDRGQYQNARESLEKSLSLFRQLGDKRYIGDVLKSLGMVEAVQSDFTRAISYYEEALSLYREISDQQGISNIYYLLGEVAKDRGDFKEAENNYLLSQTIKQEIGEKRGLALTFTGLAELALLQGRYGDAVGLVRKALVQFRNLGAKRGMLACYEILAFILHHLGQYDQAGSFASRGLKIAQEIKAPRAIAYSQVVLGLGNYAQGNLVEAETQFQEALAIFGEYGDRRNIANTLVNLAHIDMQLGDLENAEKRLAKSLSLSRRFSIRWSQAYSLSAMGSLQLGKGNYTSANDLLMESLLISIEQENQQGIMDVLRALAGLYLKTGQLDRSVQLLAISQKSFARQGYKMGVYEQQDYDVAVDTLHGQLGSSEFKKKWADGTGMDTYQLISELLAILPVG